MLEKRFDWQTETDKYYYLLRNFYNLEIKEIDFVDIEVFRIGDYDAKIEVGTPRVTIFKLTELMPTFMLAYIFQIYDMVSFFCFLLLGFNYATSV